WIDDKLLVQIEELSCYYIEFRYFDVADRSDVERILDLVYYSPIKCIDLIIKFEEENGFIEWLLEIVEKNPKIRCVNIHSARTTEVIKDNERNGIILLIEDQIESNLHCGHIQPMIFSCNNRLFTESQRHNTCLNRKIA